MIGEALLVLGAAFVLLAALGILRFSDVFVRMQILSKASTFGLLCVLSGGIVMAGSAGDIMSLLIAGVLHLVTSPVGSNLLARATYFAPDIDHHIDTVDELAVADGDRAAADIVGPDRAVRLDHALRGTGDP